MSRRPDSKPSLGLTVSTSGGLDGSPSHEALEGYVDIGSRLAAQMAEANFRSITSKSGWTAAQIEAETDAAIGRMELTSRDMLAAKGADPDGLRWSQVWAAMETRYRETMTELMRASGLRVGETLQ